MSKKSLMFVTIIVMGLVACELRQASAVSLKEKVAFIQELDARLSNLEEVGAWIKKHPDTAREAFYEIAFDEVWVHIAPVFGEHPTPLTKENGKCLESIHDGLALSPSHLTWLQSCFNRDVESSVMPEELLSLRYYLQGIEQLAGRNWQDYKQLMQDCMEQAQNANIKLAEAHALAGLGLYSEWTKKDIEAVAYYKAALNIFKQMHASDSINKIHFRLYRHTQRNAGKRYFNAGHYPDALKFFSLAFDYAQQLSDVTKQFAALASMANVEVTLGQYQDAESHLKVAFSRLDEDFQRLVATKDPLRLDHLDKGILREVGHALNISGVLDVYFGRLNNATEKYEKAQMIASALDDKLLLADVTHNIGRRHERSGNLREAIELFTEAIKLYNVSST